MTRTMSARMLTTACLVVASGVAPVMMIVSTRSLPTTFAVAAVLGLAGLALAGSLGERGRAFGALLRARPLVTGPAAALIAWALLSAVWSVEPRATLGSASQVAVSLLATLAVLVPLSGETRGRIASASLVGLAAAAVLIVLELRLGSPVRGLFTGDRHDYFLNRASLTLVVLCWPTAALLLAEGRRLPAIAIVVAAGLVAFSSASQSAALGWLTIAAAAGIACVSLPIASALVAATATIVLVGMPFLPATAYDALHHDVAQLLPQANIEARLFVWQGFSQFFAATPWHGIGLDTSRFAPRLPEAAGITGPLLVPGLSLGHPHSLSLQAWVELGWPAVALLVLLVTGAVSAAAALPFRPSARIALGFVAGIVAVASISHGAWQGWWLALILYGGFLLSRLSEPGTGD